jgi:hypothetical protein
MITVTLLHPTMEDRTLTLELPRETKFSQLTDLLYERKFVEPQKPGYRYLYKDHLCGMAHELGDYIPETADSIQLKVFDIPVIMV